MRARKRPWRSWPRSIRRLMSWSTPLRASRRRFWSQGSSMATSNSGASNSLHGGTAGIQTDPRQAADGGIDEDGTDQEEPQSKEDEEVELLQVEKKWKECEAARKFDENFRK